MPGKFTLAGAAALALAGAAIWFGGPLGQPLHDRAAPQAVWKRGEMQAGNAPAPRGEQTAGPGVKAQAKVPRAFSALLSASGGRPLEEPALDALRRWAALAPAEAAEWAAGKLAGEARGRALEEVFGIWGQSAPGAALAWLDAHGPREAFAGAYENAFSGFAHSDPAAAAAWLNTDPRGLPADLWDALFSAWGDRAPEAAARWAVANLSPEMETALFPMLLASLHSPEAAALLIAGQPGTAADPALAAAALRVTRRDPEFAAALAAKIGDPGSRDATLANVLAVWMRSDPAAAAVHAGQNQLALPAAPAGNGVPRVQAQGAEPEGAPVLPQ